MENCRFELDKERNKPKRTGHGNRKVAHEVMKKANSKIDEKLSERKKQLKKRNGER